MTSEQHSNDDADWQAAAYEQFLRDDAPEDAVYETMVEEEWPTKSDK